MTAHPNTAEAPLPWTADAIATLISDIVGENFYAPGGELPEVGYEGPAVYEGIEKVLKCPGVYVHLYGKALTKPFRKMGHVTIVDADREKAIEKARFVQATLKVIS